ncbi:MAG TPA: AAA family ATPase, partial [Armatimonadota bacterium]|nr:AAA family ATPase [Armatimonadota bacterium]
GPERPPGNLPESLTTFVGREQELSDLPARLQEARLLTLVGPGGTGKTRLSLELARGVGERFPDGVWLVELASLSEATLLPQAVADTLGIVGDAPNPPLDAVLHYLQPRALLLVLDNCEHLRASAARFAEAVLRHCPRVTLLASSREALRIEPEAVYPVPPLPVPDSRHAPEDPEAVQDCPAVRLFLDRARLAVPDFPLTPARAAAVARLCQRLDGIPLALELAAARLRSLSLEDLIARLDDRFRLLTGGSRTALPRQQTLRALVDWSHDLLDSDERSLLARLSVFAGGWTPEAAAAVCGAPPLEAGCIQGTVTRLAEKSLVTPAAGERCGMLETIRLYAAERLAASGEEDALRRRHLDHFLAVAQEGERGLEGPGQQFWLARLEEDHENLRAALRFALETDPRAALRLSGSLWWFWRRRGHFQEGREWL